MYPADDTPVRLRLLIADVRARCERLRGEVDRARTEREAACARLSRLKLDRFSPADPVVRRDDGPRHADER